VDSFAVLTALTLETPSGVRESNPKVPVRLDRLIARLLDKKPDGRPASAAEVVGELKAIEKELTEGTSPAVSVVVTAEAVAADDPDTELLTEEVKEPADLDEPPPTRRRRRKKGRRARLRRHLEIGLMAGGVAGVLALVLGVTLLLVNLNKTPPPAAPTTTPPPPAAPRPPTHTRPWDVKLPDGRVQWWWYDHSGNPRPLPPFWQPDMRLPPEFQIPQRP
jgi:hypothetical protein